MYSMSLTTLRSDAIAFLRSLPSRIWTHRKWVLYVLLCLCLGYTIYRVFGSVVGFASLGGILGLLNQTPTAPTSSVTEGRTTPVGTPDAVGWTQAPVGHSESPSILDSQDHIIISAPDNKEISLPLPQGVSPSEVKSVVLSSVKIEEVVVQDSSPVSPSQVSDLLKKYRK